MADYQIVYLICIPLIIAAEYRFGRNQLTQNRYDRWFNNLSLGLLNEAILLAAPVFIPLLVAPESTVSPVHPLLATLVVFLILDLTGYWLHRAYHQVNALWRLHRVHHCDLELDYSTTFRHHPGEVVISLVVMYLLMTTLNLEASQVIPYAITVRAVQLFAHSNIRLNARAEAVIHLLVVTPGIHQFHHSQHQLQTDSNFGEVLTIWDRLFGTYTCPRRTKEPTVIGLSEFTSENDQSVVGLLALPLRSTH